MKKKKRSQRRYWPEVWFVIIVILVWLWVLHFLNGDGILFDNSRWRISMQEIRYATYSPDGQWIAAIGGQWYLKSESYPELTILDANTGAIIFESGSSLKAFSGEFSRDGDYLFTQIMDSQLRIWETEHWQPVDPIKVTGLSGNIAAHPTENTIVLGTVGPGRTGVFIIDIPEGTVTETIAEFEYSNKTPVAISSTGDFIAYSRSQDDQSQISIVDMHSAEREKLRVPISHMITDIAWSPFANVLIFSTNDGQIFMWDVDAEDSVPEAILQQEGNIASIGFSPDGRYFAAGGEQPTTLYSTDDWSEVLRFGYGEVQSISFSPLNETIAVVYRLSPSRNSSLSVFELPE